MVQPVGYWFHHSSPSVSYTHLDVYKRQIVAKRNLATFLYQEVSPTDQSSQEGVLEKLARLGFVVNQERVLAEDMEQIWDFKMCIRDRWNTSFAGIQILFIN